MRDGSRSGGWSREPQHHPESHRQRQSLTQLEEQYGPLPETLTSATGGGGEQRLFQLAEHLDLDAIGNSVGMLGPGPNVRASGGQIVVAPSLHRSAAATGG
jgi:hypothetical protein